MINRHVGGAWLACRPRGGEALIVY